MRVRSRIILFICITFSMLPFQNCAPTHDQYGTLDSPSLDGELLTEAEIAQAFSETLHPILRENCAGCHGDNQEPRFAVEDEVFAANVIYDNSLVDFKNPADSYFVQKIQGGHNGFPRSLASEIQGGISSWNSAMAPPTSGGDGGGGSQTDSLAPGVMITAPNNLSTVSGEFELKAMAIDNIGVVGVQFYLDDSPWGEPDMSAPYAVAANAGDLLNGAHQVKAEAWDAMGNVAMSESIEFTVNNIPADTLAPAVSITAPASNSTANATITLSATASDNVGVTGVQFFVDGNPVGSMDTISPYSISLNTTTLTNAVHTVTARATDTSGNMRTSSGVSFTVNNVPPDTQVPTVNMTAPANNSTVSNTITLSATASDNVGVTGVQFYVDGNPVGALDTSSPYSISLDTTNLTNAAHTVTAIAYDAAENLRTSSAVLFTVNNAAAPVPDTQAPAVSITAPSSNSTVNATITLSATASDNVGVTGVQFYVDGNSVGSMDTSAPYSFALDSTTLTNATHTVTARAYDAAGNMRTSSGVNFNVNNVPPDTQAPSVSITAPSNNSTVNATITLSATATDNVGVTGVQFYVDGNPVGAMDTTSPYSISLDTNNFSNAAHTVTARAYDAADNERTSSGVSFTVNNVAVNPNANYQWISQNILVPRCISCHRAGDADAGVRYDTYTETMKTVRAGDPSRSDLYRETNSGSMPDSGSRLNATQMKAISDWIAAGALNN